MDIEEGTSVLQQMLKICVATLNIRKPAVSRDRGTTVATVFKKL